MKLANTLFGTMAVLAAATGPAAAEWQWVDEGSARTETRVYEERQDPYDQPRTETRIYEERRYEQPSTHYRETYTAPVVTDREVFPQGRCEVTRTHWSDGTSADDRVCRRPPFPHEIIIERMGRHFDRLRGY